MDGRSVILRLLSAYVACVGIRRRQGVRLRRALVSAFGGTLPLLHLRGRFREFCQVPSPDIPAGPVPRAKRPSLDGMMMLTTDGFGGCRRSLIVKACSADGRQLECQDTATGARSRITLA